MKRVCLPYPVKLRIYQRVLELRGEGLSYGMIQKKI
ncbi:hypothetical protein HRbin02_00744 [Candidatus Calditenuaceae archaeon HR02]|nr:hypothetical protein HRbin02_00744 [Candidatus Calditenuaceae archaeon HR02]